MSTRDDVLSPTVTPLGLLQGPALPPASLDLELPNTPAVSEDDIWAFRVVVEAKSDRGLGFDLRLDVSKNIPDRGAHTELFVRFGSLLAAEVSELLTGW